MPVTEIAGTEVHVDDEGWYDSDEDPFELLKMVAGNKRAIIMPKGYARDEDAMET